MKHLKSLILIGIASSIGVMGVALAKKGPAITTTIHNQTNTTFRFVKFKKVPNVKLSDYTSSIPKKSSGKYTTQVQQLYPPKPSPTAPMETAVTIYYSNGKVQCALQYNVQFKTGKPFGRGKLKRVTSACVNNDGTMSKDVFVLRHHNSFTIDSRKR